MDLRKTIARISIDRLLVVPALSASVTAIGLWAWNRGSSVDPKYSAQKYGISDAEEQRIPTADGTIEATVVPVTMSNEQRAQFVIPRSRSEYPIYQRGTSGGIIPVSLANSDLSRDDFVRSNPIVSEDPPEQPRPRPRKKRTTDRETLIVAGGAGAGAAIGAAAGGGSGAGSRSSIRRDCRAGVRPRNPRSIVT